MENTKIVSFIGFERSDLPYFLSIMLKNKKYRTLVIDNSCTHDLFLSLKRPDEETDHVEFDRNVYMRNKTVDVDNLESFDKFDVVIMYHGYNIEEDILQISDLTVLSLNYELSTMQYLKDYIDLEMVQSIPKEKLYVVYRDKVSTKIAEQYLMKQLGLSGIEQEYVIYYDEGNYNAYINFCYNGVQSVKGITTELKAAINAIMVALIGNDKKKRKRNKKEEEK